MPNGAKATVCFNLPVEHPAIIRDSTGSTLVRTLSTSNKASGSPLFGRTKTTTGTTFTKAIAIAEPCVGIARRQE